MDVNFDFDGTVDFTRLSNALGRDIEFSRSFAVVRSGSLDWIDPVVGLRLRHQFTPSQEVMVRGDVGGFGFQSNFEWQAVGVYSYAWQFTGYQLAALIGYRALGVNYTNTSNNNNVDLVLHGPIIGFRDQQQENKSLKRRVRFSWQSFEFARESLAVGFCNGGNMLPQ